MSSAPTITTDKTSPSLPIAPVSAGLALVLWGLSVCFHDLGNRLARIYFTWASTPGHLHPEGGRAGFIRGEYILIALLAVVGLGGVLWLVSHLRRFQFRTVAHVVLPWALWGIGVFLAWKVYIVYASEFVHLVQYALIGNLVARALQRGTQPQAAFLITAALGLVDELWQHYGLHFWLFGERTHWLDWSDITLDALGACAGILPIITRAHLDGTQLMSRPRLFRLSFLFVAALSLPLLLLDPVTSSRLFGAYDHYPFWSEFNNLKPVHWPLPSEGIPLCLAALLLINNLLDPQRRPYSQKTVLALLVLVTLAIQPQSRRRGQPVHQVVAQVQVPWINPAASRAENRGILIDGNLDEAAWQQAPRLGPFVNTLDGTPWDAPLGTAEDQRLPLQPTWARLLWDDSALYIAIEAEDDDLWARNLGRDEFWHSDDDRIEISIDEGNDEITYYTFAVTPHNVVGDLFEYIPAAPLDYNPWNRHVGLPQWEAPTWRSAVQLHGTLDLVPQWGSTPTRDLDQGYTVEIAIPWETFNTTSIPHPNAIRQTTIPQPGERWRLGLFRREIPRVHLDTSKNSTLLDREKARQVLHLSEAAFTKLLATGKLSPSRPGGSQFQLKELENWLYNNRLQRQAWSPTYHNSFYYPSRFGVIEFVK